MAKGIEVLAKVHSGAEGILSSEALAFVERLHRQFQPTRRKLLERRARRQRDFNAGALPAFLEETKSIREGNWKVAGTPPDLEQRWVEITGPSERKMMINAFNSGADVFMSDFEDSLSPTWDNLVVGQANLVDAVRRRLSFVSSEGKSYKLNEKIATLLVRPRGWHLPEKHVTVDGEAVSGSLFDFGLYFFHNARERLDRGTGPYFYLPKTQSHLEARLWNDVFLFAQDALGIPRGSVRATVLIETLPAAFEMDEILYELREHMSGLNAGRWDYLFSVIKTLSWRGDVLPDRGQVIRPRGLREGARGPGKPERAPAPGGLRRCRHAHRHSRARRNRDGRGIPAQRQRCAPVLELVAYGHRRRGDLQPDGGCRHGRDLPLAALAVGPQPGDARGWTAGHAGLFETIRGEELARLGGPSTGRLGEAAEILDGLVGTPDFVEFLTLPAYKVLE